MFCNTYYNKERELPVNERICPFGIDWGSSESRILCLSMEVLSLFKVKRAHLIEYGQLWPWIQACHWDLGGMTTSLSLILLICAARVIMSLLSQRINMNTWWGCVYVGNTAGRLPRQLFQFFPSGCCWTCAPHVPLPLGNSEPTISLASNLPSSVHHSGTYY